MFIMHGETYAQSFKKDVTENEQLSKWGHRKRKQIQKWKQKNYNQKRK